MSAGFIRGSQRLSALLLAFVLLVSLVSVAPVKEAQAAGSKLTASTVTVKAAGRSFTVKTVRIPKGTATAVGLANHQVGRTASLSSIASAYGAKAAINGAFFDSYGGPPDPYGTLISGGRLMHIGRYGTTIGFTANGTAMMDSLRIEVSGQVTPPEGRGSSWYAVWFNRIPSSTASGTSIVYTPDRGSTTGYNGGVAVTVRNGKVVLKKNNANSTIPSDGYVIVFSGDMKSMADRFVIGSKVTMDIRYTNIDGKAIPWENVVTAVGAGPRLVTDGKLALNAAAEGFQDPKILNAAGARSGIAIMSDGSVMIATVPGATMKQWAAVMQKLGAVQAMNLDGGASSGMLAGGKVVTSPGRLLSNTLVFGGTGN
ncbi:phosphodiester glycosidase family protein [Paenibacillus hunanensis]|uniref:phosphodiester glycosidase family protein n=1 Tax=Paenibacillus hunanensis TaxID=539262 RepID=UPI002A6B71DC|nr:phosphodiester glycosidase family protein [Paenibacillus hunanensis]WPP40221.1 phosphodiester glycosidase family protein [Paenibacillus hunanensis]